MCLLSVLPLLYQIVFDSFFWIRQVCMAMFGSSVSMQASLRQLLLAETVVLCCSYINEKKNVPHYINDNSGQLLKQLLQRSSLLGVGRSSVYLQNESFLLKSTFAIRLILKICRINIFLIR